MTVTEASIEPTARRGPATTVGVILMGLSLGLWVVLPVVPFLPLGVAAKATVATTQVIVAEIIFWLGAALAGPAAVRRMRSWWRIRSAARDARAE